MMSSIASSLVGRRPRRLASARSTRAKSSWSGSFFGSASRGAPQIVSLLRLRRVSRVRARLHGSQLGAHRVPSRVRQGPSEGQRCAHTSAQGTRSYWQHPRDQKRAYVRTTPFGFSCAPATFPWQSGRPPSVFLLGTGGRVGYPAPATATHHSSIDDRGRAMCAPRSRGSPA